MAGYAVFAIKIKKDTSFWEFPKMACPFFVQKATK